MQYGVIMAGGSGTRLWPMSRGDTPKQLLPVIRGKSLLQLSYERLREVFPPERIFVCTLGSHGKAILENLPELPKENLLGEPEGRDTAAAIGFSAAVLHQKDKDAVMAVVTADHVIEPVSQFQTSLKTALQVVDEHPESLVTFGIIATYGHTGLGYIHRGEQLHDSAYKVMAFKEKPDKPTADRYVESGRYYWNSGMFVWRCDTVLGELQQHLPTTYAGLMKIATAWNSTERQNVLGQVYPTLQKISVDFAIMEPASQHKGNASVVVVEMPVQWLDVGSWPQLAETMTTDEHNNATDVGRFVFVDSDDNIIVSQDPNHLMATIGISDMIIVHTRDATMICPKSESQRVKDLANKVKEKYGSEFT
jgi:mannose-1-phosphate guanylyltransferase